MDRIEQARSVGLVMMLAPLLMVALVIDYAQPAVLFILAPAVSLVGLAVVLWAQMVQAAEERMLRDYRR